MWEPTYHSLLEGNALKMESGWFGVFAKQDFPSVVVVGLGKKAAGVDDQENWHEGKENIRVAVAGYFTFDVYLILMEIPKGSTF